STAGTGFYFDTTASRNISYTKMVGTAKSADDLKSASMADTLNGERSGEDAVWAYDADKNAGFPYLKKNAATFDSHTVSFDAGSFTTIEAQTIRDNGTAVIPKYIDKNYYISGWYTDQDLTDEYDFATPVIADMVLYAKIEDAKCWTDGLTADLGYAFSGGAGTETEPYLISTPTDLAMLSLNVYELDGYRDYYFRQTCDIDLEGNCWLPIGSNDRAFRGSFDGNGYKIKNALVDNENDTRIGKKVGFFGYTDSAAVKNVCLENISVIYKNPNMSGDAMGALLIAGCYNNTIVTDCSVQGAIRAEDYMNMIGGLIGYVNTSSVTVTDSFVIGSMTVSAGAKYAGGFWGIDRAINVRNCYSAMEMNLTDNVNYLYAFGCGESDPERNCYYDQTLFGKYTARQGLGEPKTTAQMRTAELADLLNGNRIGNEAVWTYDTDVNIGYPYLIGKAPSYVNCTVSFETAHGAKPADIVVLSGSRITEPEILIDAYSIEGWYSTPTFDEGTKFDFDEPVVEDMTLYAKWVPGKLSGSAELAGNAVYGETLKVNVTDHNNADIGFTYEWYTRKADSDERVLIDGEKGDSYVIGAEDIGKVIVCLVVSKELTGSIEAESAVVEKAVNTNVPDVSMRRPTNGNNSDGRIIGTDATMEYSTTADFSVNVNACSDGETVVAHIGTYYVRYKESATHLAGEATAVTVLEFLEPLEAHFVLGGENSVTYNAELNRYEYVYTTTAIKPDVMVTGYGRELVVGRDYKITYKRNTNVMAGKNPSIAVVTITGKGNYSGSKMLNFHIIPKDIEDGDINIGGLYVKEGTAAAPTLLYNGYQLTTKDYKLAGSTGKLKTSDADPKITVTGKGNFTGTRELVISVLNKTEFADRTIKVATNGKLSFPFDGEPKELEVTSDLNDKKHLIVTNKAGELLKKDEDFILDYSPNVHAGTVKVKVTGIDKYNGTVETKFTITPAKTAVITSVLIDDSGKPCNEFTFDKGKVKPELDVKAKIGDTEFSLVEGVDYSVTYRKNSSVGTGSYKLKLTGDFKGAALAKDYDTSFIISPKKLKDPEIRVGDKTYNVRKKKYKDYISKPIVILDGYLLTTSEYTVSYYDKEGNVLNKNADLILNAANQTEEITVKIGLNSRCRNYVLDGDEPESTYTVQMPAENQKIDISKVKITLTDNTGRKITSVQYTGEPIVFDGDKVDGLFNQAVLTVTVGNLKKGGYVLRGSEVFEKFNVIYSNNLNPGTGTIILTPKQDNGQYIGIKKSTFKIAKLKVKDHLKVK
ncbi:MAG: InlB B-repeat-containing protein, partial [Lachnospiraceae bacterium]|nr:InlB B-repeat-containing protein [Lachnospiraceae bacterium]